MSTKIEWCDEVWNPVTGCTKISAGCQNCYAERMAKRLRGRYGYPADDPFRVTFHPDKLDQPRRWRNPRRVFVDSMGDLFHEEVAQGWLFHVFDAMADAKQHIFHALTKRPENIQAKLYEGQPRYFSKGDYLPNVHLGTTVENQEMADQRISYLMKCPAAKRFLSCEPLLGPVDLNLATACDRNCNEYIYAECPGTHGPCVMQPLVDQVIIGCETGPNRRPCKLEWVRDLVQQCDAAGVPVFIKQLNAFRCRCGRVHVAGTEPGSPSWEGVCYECGLHESRMTPFVSRDLAEWPQWARRREFPVATEGLTR